MMVEISFTYACEYYSLIRTVSVESARAKLERVGTLKKIEGKFHLSDGIAKNYSRDKYRVVIWNQI